MKRCPTCNRTYTDPNLSFCIEDGTPLAIVKENEPTVSPPQFGDEFKTDERANDWHAVAYQPPGTYVPPGGSSKRKVWPWVLGIVGVVVLGLVGLSIAAAILVPRMMRNAPRAADNPPSQVAEKDNSNSNRNDNASAVNNNSNENDKGLANTNTNAPTDTDLVLAQLTNLEHEWTVANVNADKKKLARILADDYAGPSGEGQIQGKAEYLKNIQRDPSVQKWEFRNLKLTLRGDRATLSGRLILRRDNVDTAYDFVDKFIWRDLRWQATGSEVTPVQETSLD